MRSFVNRSVRLSNKEEDTLERAVKRAAKSIFEREKSPIKRRILLDSIPLITYHQVTFSSLNQELKLIDEERVKKVKKPSSKR